MTELITGPDWPTVLEFEYNEDETISSNFARLIDETLGINEPWSTTDPNAVVTLKGSLTVMVHIDVEKSNDTIGRIMYLFYWFMEEYGGHFPGDNKRNVFQILG